MSKKYSTRSRSYKHKESNSKYSNSKYNDSNNNTTDTSVYSILKSILKKQNTRENQMELEVNFLAPNDLDGDTIPILLYSSVSAEPFSVYGNIGHCLPDLFGPFKTSFFRIEEVKNSSYIFSLLRPS